MIESVRDSQPSREWSPVAQPRYADLLVEEPQDSHSMVTIDPTHIVVLLSEMEELILVIGFKVLDQLG
jgi:hypothetical protein